MCSTSSKSLVYNDSAELMMTMRQVIRTFHNLFKALYYEKDINHVARLEVINISIHVTVL